MVLKMVWNDTRSVRELPKEILKNFLDMADFLYFDLSTKKLHVILIDAPYKRFEGHKIRSVASRNPL